MRELLLILPEGAIRGELDVNLLRDALEARGADVQDFELADSEDRILDWVEAGCLPLVVKGAEPM